MDYLHALVGARPYHGGQVTARQDTDSMGSPGFARNTAPVITS